MASCAICGSRFAEKRCYFCQRHVCTSCITPDDVTGSPTTVKCLDCQRKGINKISLLAVAKRNKFIFGIIAGFWVFAVFPLPFLDLTGYEAEVLATILQPVLIAAAVMSIPFIFMMLAWQKRAPKGY
ncbi:hypothetical protein [Nitrososphaera sp.]|uniref:hypothetical protein n=1 Tax=Nitrososphaera sp. TaxID=1971748 RepID=UPI00307D6DBF